MARIFSRWRHLLAALLALAVLPAFAQDDPPGRVGRIADVQGQVWYFDLESGDWASAVRNRPLTTGDRVATDGDGRVEIRIGSSTIRLGAGSEIDLLQVDDAQVRVQLHSGHLALRLRSHEVAREFELVTAEGRFKPDRAGRYRLDRVDATTGATVWSGQMLFETPDNAATLVAGQRVEVTHSFGRTVYTVLQPQRDAFADEVAAAEATAERSVATTRYLSPEMTGADALDGYGRWIEDAEQGTLWVPRAVAPGWVPYRYGHWAWIRPWGWTWVDDAPWGFAPFHYGRWVFWRNAWCWAPGRWVARPVYAPALVAWVGAPLVGIPINIGPSVGWFPLGPREVFIPAYRVSPRYVQNVNVTHVTNITNVTQIINSPNTVVQQTNYIYRGAPHAVTVVPVSVVSGRKPVAPARVQLTDPHPSRPDDRKVALATQAPVTVAPPVAAPTPAVVSPQPRPRSATTLPAPTVSNGTAPPSAAPPTAAPGSPPRTVAPMPMRPPTPKPPPATQQPPVIQQPPVTQPPATQPLPSPAAPTPLAPPAARPAPPIGSPAAAPAPRAAPEAPQALSPPMARPPAPPRQASPRPPAAPAPVPVAPSPAPPGQPVQAEPLPPAAPPAATKPAPPQRAAIKEDPRETSNPKSERR